MNLLGFGLSVLGVSVAEMICVRNCTITQWIASVTGKGPRAKVWAIMTDPNRIDNPPPEPAKNQPVGAETIGKKPLKTVAEDEVVDVSKLSKEEQMALYEKELKESDWGHQPC
jgi:hypothetical protein